MDRTLMRHPLFVALFGLIGGVFLASSASAATGLEAISPSQPEYTLGDTAVIYGTGFAAGSSVILEVIRSDESIVTGSGTDTPGSDTVTVSPTGTFTYFYLIDGASPLPFAGTLTANAKDQSTGTVLATTTFKDGTQFMLQGCSNDRGDCTLDPPPSWAGGGTSRMTGWTSGNLKGWFEGDNVPYRLRIGLRDEGSAGTFYFTTEHDNMKDGILGIDDASNFYVGYGPVGSIEGTLTKTCRLQASGSAVPTTLDPCIVTGPTYTGTGTGPSVKKILYAWAVLFDADEDGGNDKKWAAYWTGHLASGSHLWPGSSLHTDTTATGAQDVPISDVEERATGANLSITKTAPATVYVGQSLTYTIVVTNAGPNSATNVQVSDALPMAVIYGTATTTLGTCSMTGGVVTCNIGTLANGASATVTIVVTPLAAGPLSNTACVSSAVADPNSSNNTSTTTTTVNPSADVSITKSASPSPVLAGQDLTYTIVVTNNGPSAATGVTVTDTLPANVTWVSTNTTLGTCTGTTTVNCTLGTMTNGQSATIAIVVKPTAAAAGTSLSNTATVSSSTYDPTPGDHTTPPVSTPVSAAANLSIIKTAAPDPVPVGQNLVYTITVANGGPNAAPSVTMTDPLPTNVTWVSTTVTPPSAGTCSGTTTVSCNLGTMTNGQNVTIKITVTPTALAVPSITNTATVSSGVGDPVPSNNSSTTTTTVTASADVSITKSASPSPVLAGQNLTYTLAVVNNGPSAATGVSVTDTLPANVTWISTTVTPPSAGTCSGSATVTCTLGTMTNGQNVTIAITVKPTALAVPSITNTAIVSSGVGDPVPSNDSSTTTTSVNPGADLSITKSASAGSVVVGNNLTYTIVVTNNGPSSASSVGVTDTLPANVTWVSTTVTPPSAGTCSGSATVSCNLGTMTSGQSVTIKITVTPTALAVPSITNTATVSSPTGDPVPGDHTTPPVTTTVTSTSADLSTTKFVSPTGSVLVGASLQYTISVYNAGPNSADGITVTDTLPAGVAFVSASASPGPCTTTTVSGITTVSCDLGSSLGQYANRSATINVTAAAPGTWSNTATVSATTSDPNSTNDISPPVTTTVNPPPSAGPLGGSAFSNAGGAMASGNYQLISGVAGQGIGHQGGFSTNYLMDAGYAPGVTGG